KELEAEGVKEAEGAQTGLFAAPTPQVDPAETELAIPDEVKYDIVDNAEKLKALAEVLAGAKHLALAIETDGAHYKLARIVGIALSHAAGYASYIPIGHDMLGAE